MSKKIEGFTDDYGVYCYTTLKMDKKSVFVYYDTDNKDFVTVLNNGNIWLEQIDIKKSLLAAVASGENFEI